VFEPTSVLNTLYKEICYEASREALLSYEKPTDILLPSGFVKMIEGQMKEMFHDVFHSSISKVTAKVHMSVLRRFQSSWADIFSFETCLVCLRRRPQYGLPCGHCICENCVIVFGQRSPRDPYLFQISKCFLCGLITSDTNIRVNPPTAGYSVLCIEGGGVRGVGPLACLQQLQDRINLPIPVQRFFKVVFGVSSGRK
jgi:hypothetical protein